ncbi:hypothetical protein ACOSQ3_019979 [Xanthoceras sorbifolium]
MSPKGIVELCESLILENSVEPVTQIDDRLKEAGARKLALCLAGKIISNKLVNRVAFRAIIPKIWGIKQDVDVEVVAVVEGRDRTDKMGFVAVSGVYDRLVGQVNSKELSLSEASSLKDSDIAPMNEADVQALITGSGDDAENVG